MPVLQCNSVSSSTGACIHAERALVVDIVILVIVIDIVVLVIVIDIVVIVIVIGIVIVQTCHCQQQQF